MSFAITLANSQAVKGGKDEKGEFLYRLMYSTLSALLYVVAEIALKILYIPLAVGGGRMAIYNTLLVGAALAALTLSSCSQALG